MDIRPQGMVKKSGDTMTGDLILTSGNITISNNSVYNMTTVGYVGISGSCAIGFGLNGTTTIITVNTNNVFFPVQAPNATPPAYVKGGIYFDTTLNKLRVGGAAGWETITSV